MANGSIFIIQLSYALLGTRKKQLNDFFIFYHHTASFPASPIYYDFSSEYYIKSKTFSKNYITLFEWGVVGCLNVPLSLPFLLGTDFLAGDMVSSDALTGDEKIIFAEVNTGILMLLLSVSALLCILAGVWILRCNSNKWQVKSGKMEIATALVVMLSFSFAIAGCSDNEESRNFVYNLSADYDCGEYEIVQDTETLNYYFKNTSMGEAIEPVRSPAFGVFSDEEKVRCRQHLYIGGRKRRRAGSIKKSLRR